jgi:hypothetical protein
MLLNKQQEKKTCFQITCPNETRDEGLFSYFYIRMEMIPEYCPSAEECEVLWGLL